MNAPVYCFRPNNLRDVLSCNHASHHIRFFLSATLFCCGVYVAVSCLRMPFISHKTFILEMAKLITMIAFHTCLVK
ncbi:unnamed protein product [Prunus brigantina]